MWGQKEEKGTSSQTWDNKHCPSVTIRSASLSLYWGQPQGGRREREREGCGTQVCRMETDIMWHCNVPAVKMARLLIAKSHWSFFFKQLRVFSKDGHVDRYGRRRRSDIVFLFTVLLLLLLWKHWAELINSVPLLLFPFSGFVYKLCTGKHSPIFCLTVFYNATVRPRKPFFTTSIQCIMNYREQIRLPLLKTLNWLLQNRRIINVPVE